MHFFKYILVTSMITLSTLFLVACEGGEADYSLDELQKITQESSIDDNSVTLTTSLDSLQNDYALDATDNAITIDSNLDDTIVYSVADSASPFVIVDGVLQPKDASTLEIGEYIVSVVAEDANGNKIEKLVTIFIVADKNFVAPLITTTSFTVKENSTDSLQIKTLFIGNGKFKSVFFSGGVDDALFTLSTTGELMLKSAADFEDNVISHTLKVKVQADDDLGNVSEVKEITITVSDVDEKYTFTSSNHLTVLDNNSSFAGQIVAVANDINMPAAEYSFEDSTVPLGINLTTGAMQFAQAVTAGDSFSVNVIAQNQYNGSRTVSETIIIDVVPDYSQMLPTLVGYETAVTTIPTQNIIVHVDADPADPKGEVTFSLEGDDADLFKIDIDGDVSFIAVEDYYSPRDSDKNNVFNIAVLVTDNNGYSVKTNTIVITQIEDPAKMKPVITTTEVYIAENTLGHESISFTTPGSGEVTEFIVVAGTEFIFENGFLQFSSVKPDFEAKPNYIVDLQLKDEFGNLSEIKTVSVVIMDVDEGYNFTSQIYFAPTEKETIIGTVVAVPKINSDATVIYSIAVDNSNKFSIDSSTGALIFKTPTVYADTNVTYTLKVGVASQYNGAYTISPEITVQVTPLARTITFVSQEVAIVPEVMSQNPTIQISASSEDNSANIVYAMQTGTDGSIFSITQTGLMTITVPKYKWSSDPDANVYRGAVVASDQYGNKKVQQGEMHVTTEVDGKPYFTSNATLSIIENTTWVTNISANSHISPVPILTYSIIGGTDSSLFSLSTSGDLNFNDFANYELRDSYNLIVEVTDNLGHPDSSTQQTITINVNDVSDKPSSFTFDNGTTSATVNDGYHKFFVVAYDRTSYVPLKATPSPSNGVLTYALTGSYDSSLFSIENGRLKVVAPPRSGDKTYPLRIKVSEDKGESWEQTFYLTIHDQ